jgi:hypothetical protein
MKPLAQSLTLIILTTTQIKDQPAKCSLHEVYAETLFNIWDFLATMSYQKDTFQPGAEARSGFLNYIGSTAWRIELDTKARLRLPFTSNAELYIDLVSGL